MTSAQAAVLYQLPENRVVLAAMQTARLPPEQARTCLQSVRDSLLTHPQPQADLGCCPPDAVTEQPNDLAFEPAATTPGRTPPQPGGVPGQPNGSLPRDATAATLYIDQ